MYLKGHGRFRPIRNIEINTATFLRIVFFFTMVNDLYLLNHIKYIYTIYILETSYSLTKATIQITGLQQIDFYDLKKKIYISDTSYSYKL